jgi:hypothetical protein
VITRIALAWLAVLLAVPLAHGRDEPKKDEPKKDEKPLSAKEQYDQLVKQYADERRQLVAEINKAKGDERNKLMQKYTGQGKEYADRFLKLAEDHPKDEAGTAALFWVLQNGGTAAKQVEEKVVALIPDMKLADLKTKLAPLMSPTAGIVEAVSKRVESAESDPLAADVLGWLATTRVFPASPKTTEIASAASSRLIEKYPDNPAVIRICQMLARSRSVKDADQLKTIAEKTANPKVKAEAVYALGQQMSSRLDALADKPDELEKVAVEAEKVLASAVDLFGKAELTARKDAAQIELTAFRTTRVGKEAPEIQAEDLDGVKFKLSDYRGKVVMLDFWGHW